MKLTAVVRMFALFLLAAGTLLIHAQDQRDTTKPSQDEARPEEAKPAQNDAKAPRQQEDAKPGKQQDEMKPRQDEAKPDASANRNDARPGQENKPAQDNMAHPAQDGRPAEQHAAGGRIPDDQFRAHFGREHTVVINHPTIVEGQPRFQYGGYWFAISDPWPAGWAYTDNCYIDYVDGEYFLFDLLHPGVRVAILVVT
ncbi:MAG: hypothetical protein ABR874_03060 [Candidatus Sulfotelmatobacter sp.]|jgi:hypothetical protein